MIHFFNFQILELYIQMNKMFTANNRKRLTTFCKRIFNMVVYNEYKVYYSSSAFTLIPAEQIV